MNNLAMSSIEIGQVFKTNQGGSFTVVEINGYSNIVIEHNDTYKHRQIVRLQRIATGEIKNPWFPSLCGVGFVGVGYYDCKDKDAVKLWRACIVRSNCIKTKTRQPCYQDVTIDEKWHNFQNFAKWFYSQPYYQKGFQLDKDILIKNNKVYSESSCVLVPQEINKLFIEKADGGRGIPVGVIYNNNKYEAKAAQKYLGSFDTPNEASRAYYTARYQQVKYIISLWQGKLDPKVIEKLKELENKFIYKTRIKHD